MSPSTLVAAHDKRTHTKISLLEAEIAATDNLITTHQRRLAILRELRNLIVSNDGTSNIVVAGDGSTREETSAFSIREIVDTVLERLDRLPNNLQASPSTMHPEASSSKHDSSSSSAHLPSHSFDPTQWIATRRRFTLPGRVTALGVVGVPRRGGGASYRQQRHRKAVRGLDVIAVVLKRSKNIAKLSDHGYDWLHGEPGSSVLIIYNNVGHILTFLELKSHGIDATVTTLALHLNTRDPIVVTGDDSGSIQVHNVTMYQFGRFVTGRRLPMRDYSGRIINLDGDDSEWRKDGIDIRIDTLKELFHVPKDYAVLKVAIKRGRYQDNILATDSGGNVHLIMQNGTVAMEYLGSPNQDMQFGTVLPGRRGETMAIVDGSVIRFLRPPTPHFLPNACEGTTAKITSLVRDSMRAQYYYAGTSEGSILVFDITGNNLISRSTTYQGSGPRAGGFSKCALIYKLPVIPGNTSQSKNSGVHNVTVYVVAGFLIATTPSGYTAAFNTSNVWRTTPELFWKGGRMGARLMGDLNETGTQYDSWLFSVTEIKGATPVSTGATMVSAVYSQSSSHSQIAFHASLLPAAESQHVSGDTLSWLRGPVIIVSVGGVILFQFWKRRRPQSSPAYEKFPGLAREFGGAANYGPNSSTMGIGDGGRGMNMESFETMRRQIERMGSLNYEK